jgi:uncharacterized protein (TIGR02145 family)
VKLIAGTSGWYTSGSYDLVEETFTGDASNSISFNAPVAHLAPNAYTTLYKWLPILPDVNSDWPALNLEINGTTTIDNKLARAAEPGKNYLLYAQKSEYDISFTALPAASYYFDIPDFSQSQVYKVMDGDKQVAQITKEFLREKDVVLSQAVVVYPVNEEGKVVFERGGYVAQILKQNSDLTDVTFNFIQPSTAVHGGEVIFDRVSKKITSYVQGSVENPVTTVYMPGDIDMGHIEVPGSKKVTVVPDLIEDVRGTEVNNYPIVKIGMQYWMAKNLNTIYYNEGKSYEAIPTNFANNKVGDFAFCCVFNSNDATSTNTTTVTNRERYGVLYSFLTIGGYASFEESGLTNGGVQANDYLSPDGWIVPTVNDLEELGNYIGVGPFAGPMVRLREFINYDTNKQIIMAAGRETDEGITGFAGRNGSYRATGGGYTALEATNGCWVWSRSFNSGTDAYLLNMGSIQSRQPIRRAASIRSIKKEF